MGEQPKQEIPLDFSGAVIYEAPAHIANLKFRGRKTFVGAYSYSNIDSIVYDSDIGRFVSIGPRSLIGPLEHPTNWLSSHGFVFGDKGVFRYSDEYQEIVSDEKFQYNNKRTIIGNDVWIGSNVFIRRGVHIGNGAIISANSSVVNDIPPYCIVGGNPAKIIKLRFSTEIIEKLNKLQWWEYFLDRSIIGDINYSDVSSSIERIEGLVNEGKIQRLSPNMFMITAHETKQVVNENLTNDIFFFKER